MILSCLVSRISKQKLFWIVSISLSGVVMLLFVNLSCFSLLSEHDIAQLIGDLRCLRFNILIRGNLKGLPFTDANVNAALSPRLF